MVILVPLWLDVAFLMLVFPFSLLCRPLLQSTTACSVTFFLATGSVCNMLTTVIIHPQARISSRCNLEEHVLGGGMYLKCVDGPMLSVATHVARVSGHAGE
jgi:hypothetical protein